MVVQPSTRFILVALLVASGASLGSCQRSAPAPDRDAGKPAAASRPVRPRVVAAGEIPVNIATSRISLSVIKDRDTTSPVVGKLVLRDGAVSLDATPASARLSIDLDSFDSGIPLRNERVRGIFFETSAIGWETGELSVPSIPADVVRALREKKLAPHAALDGTLRIHGHAVPVKLVVDAGYGDNGRLWVKTTSPAQVKISDFDLTDNLRHLSAICMHDSIDDIVEVTVALEFGAR